MNFRNISSWCIRNPVAPIVLFVRAPQAMEAMMGYHWPGNVRELEHAIERAVILADGPVILFIHGTAAWSGLWRETMAPLAEAGYRCIAIDIPPFGYSERPTTPSYGNADQARRIVSLLDALGIERAILLGHSFGGGATMECSVDIINNFVGVDPTPVNDATVNACVGAELLQRVLDRTTNDLRTDLLVTFELKVVDGLAAAETGNASTGNTTFVNGGARSWNRSANGRMKKNIA